jgi:hypothetical protein
MSAEEKEPHFDVHGSADHMVTTERDGHEITAAEAEADLPPGVDGHAMPSSRDLAAEQHHGRHADG